MSPITPMRTVLEAVATCREGRGSGHIPRHRHPTPAPIPTGVREADQTGRRPSLGGSHSCTSDSWSLPLPLPPGAPTTIAHWQQFISAPKAPEARSPSLLGTLNWGQAHLSPYNSRPGWRQAQEAPHSQTLLPNSNSAVSAEEAH